MSFFNRFRNPTHAQLAETKHGSWKAEMDAFSRKFFNVGTVLKGAALVGVGLMIAIPPVGGAIAGVVGMAYGLGVVAQGTIRTGIDKRGLDEYGLPKSVLTHPKNLARYLVQPF